VHIETGDRVCATQCRLSLENDPFDEWEAEPVVGYRLTEV
jgi:hypothetical protein